MMSIRTQDRMSLVPYDKSIEIRFDEQSVVEKGEWLRNNNIPLSDITKYEHECKHHIYIDGFRLGTYATKERALEVLDYIELDVKYESTLFVMPKE